jgi:choline monooxygenase
LIGRPGLTPDDGEFVSFLLHRPPAGAPPARPVDVSVADGADFGLVIGQDVSMMARMQRGLHQPGLTHLSLSSEECRIINLHRNLEHYLGLEPTTA